MSSTGEGMREHNVRRVATRLAAAVTLSGLVVTMAAPAAWADTSQATAQAVSLKLGTSPVVTSGTQSASNDGTQSTVSSGATPALSVLGTQSTITAGLLAQTAVAFANGSSAACAGLIGAGGQIQIGTDGNCTISGGGAGGVTLNLPNAVTLRATAILEECFASSTGTPTAEAQLVDATLSLAGQPAVVLPVNPAAGTTENASLLSLGLNDQSTPQPGEIKATALSLDVLNTIDLTIGNVTCGPNAITSPTSVLPGSSLPIAAGTLAAFAVGFAAWWRRSRRVARI
jgi:hypothetical protein